MTPALRTCPCGDRHQTEDRGDHLFVIFAELGKLVADDERLGRCWPGVCPGRRRRPALPVAPALTGRALLGSRLILAFPALGFEEGPFLLPGATGCELGVGVQPLPFLFDRTLGVPGALGCEPGLT